MWVESDLCIGLSGESQRRVRDLSVQLPTFVLSGHVTIHLSDANRIDVDREINRRPCQQQDDEDVLKGDHLGMGEYRLIESIYSTIEPL